MLISGVKRAKVVVSPPVEPPDIEPLRSTELTTGGRTETTTGEGRNKHRLTTGEAPVEGPVKHR